LYFFLQDMMRKACIVICALVLSGCRGTTPAPDAVIALPKNASALETLAAHEARRYVYLRTGTLPPLTTGSVTQARTRIVIARKDQPEAALSPDDKAALQGLGPQQYLLRTTVSDGQKTLWILGGDDTGTLYGTYRFVEHLGVRFYLHGDVVPDDRVTLALPDLNETGKPLFELRGIQPFHDFPEGPDWWETDDYLAHISQLAKLRMNFIGFHCYPERGRGPEPLIWLGLPGDFDPRGQVRWCYPAQWHSTAREGMWGYAAMTTSEFAAGAGRLFPDDVFGHSVMTGMMPRPRAFEEGTRLFNNVGTMLRTAFDHARALGVKTCIGTETPLTIPRMVWERWAGQGKTLEDPAALREVYEGTFRRLAATHPLDYFWLWTPEDWTWGGNDTEEFRLVEQNLQVASAALQAAGNPFRLATCGWVLGPANDRAALQRMLPKDSPMGCINREVGHAIIERAFANIRDRPKWAIPWLENDWSLTTSQLWAGRIRYDAADALRLGCTGLFGLHWRTKIIAPNIAALAAAAWDQSWVPPDFNREVIPPSRAADEPTGSVMTGFRAPVAGTEDAYLYQTMRCNMDRFVIDLPNGVYAVTLKFCEGEFNQAGQRVFDIQLQGQTALERLDIFERAGRHAALDLTFTNITVLDEKLQIDFVPRTGLPCLSAFVVDGQTAPTDGVPSRPYIRKINCGGLHYQDYSQDLFVERLPDWNRGRTMPLEDFYLDFARANFGTNVAEPIARIFIRLDGPGLPEPACWYRGGPGHIMPNPVPWAVTKRKYAFVEEWAGLQSRVQGAGNRARFDYWLNTFRCMSTMAEIGCLRAELDERMTALAAETDPEKFRSLARAALGTRMTLARTWETMLGLQLAATDTPGELGTLANFEQHNRKAYQYLNLYDKELAQALGQPLPAEAEPTKRFLGAPRLIVPTVRTQVSPGEALTLRIIALDERPMKRAWLKWRLLGESRYRKLDLHHLARAVYRVTLPAAESDFEYCIEAEPVQGTNLVWPPTAPTVGQTVVVCPLAARQ
jgi:hypothetical protein